MIVPGCTPPSKGTTSRAPAGAEAHIITAAAKAAQPLCLSMFAVPCSNLSSNGAQQLRFQCEVTSLQPELAKLGTFSLNGRPACEAKRLWLRKRAGYSHL